MADYITEDYKGYRIEDLLAGLRVCLGEGEDPADADIDLVIHYLVVLEDYLTEVLQPAADSLIEVHRATGIDLKHAPAWLRFAQSVRPDFSIEGEREW